MNWRTLYGRKGRASEGIIRSLGPAAWFRPGVGVTGTLTASNWADQSGNGRDWAQGSAGNQPIYLPYAGSAYAYLPGANSNNFTTPDSAAASITSDLDIRVKIAMDDWTPTGNATLVSKWTSTGNKRSYLLQLAGGGSSGKLVGYISQDGTNLIGPAVSSVATGIADGATKWVRMTWLNSSNAVQFFTSDDGETWTQLGTDQSLSATGINDNDAVVSVGGLDGGSSEIPLGKIYRAQIYNGINGTLAVDFDPSTFVETSTNGTTATASTGEVWTLNSTGAYPATIVKSPQLLFGGVDEYMKTSAFTLNQPETAYLVMKQVTWTVSDSLMDGNTNTDMRIYQAGTTPGLRLQGVGGQLAQNDNLAVGAFGILTGVWNGASSLFQVNQTTATTGDTGAGGAGGITLGSQGDGLGTWSNIIVKEVLIFAAAHNASQRALVQNYLAARHGLVL